MDRDATGGAARAPRNHFFLSANVAAAGRPAVIARVRNLSVGGMMIETRDGLVAGDPIVAELRGIGRVSGTVAWASGHRAGIRFDTPVDPELARKPVAGGESTPDFVKPIIVEDRRLGEAAKAEPERRLD